MPTYEYACKHCGKHHEIFQSITAPPLKRCPACHKAGLKRLISGGAGLIFKGTGFYITDYKRAAEPSKSSGEPASSAEKKAPAPDPKSPPKPTPTPVSPKAAASK